MFKKKQLIFVALLSGCTTIANHEPAFTPINQVEHIKEAGKSDSLLKSIDSTLEEADAILDEIEKNKANTKKKLINLEQTHLKDEELIAELQAQNSKKDSLITNYIKHHKLLHRRLKITEDKLETVIHNCTTECTPTINHLTEENQYLKTHIDSLTTQLNYTDSLILTSKKLTKVYGEN